MKAFINRQFLEQTHFDSGTPGGLAMVVHQFKEPGKYVVTFLRDEQVVERLPLTVMEAPTETEALPVQVTIDLGKIQQPVQTRPIGELEQHFVVRHQGYASFTRSDRGDNYAIVVAQIDDGGRTEPFDTRRLGPDDIFAVTLVRPGTYSLANVLTGAQGKITVAYPTIGKEPYRPPEPLPVECIEGRFVPDVIDLQPAQGLIFHFDVPSRITIELVEPNDGPEPTRRSRVARWEKLPAKGRQDRKE